MNRGRGAYPFDFSPASANDHGKGAFAVIMTSRADIEDMIARIKLRDKLALAELYDCTTAKLFGVCLHILKDRSEAEDVLHEVYLRVWNKADTYAVTGHSPMTWLITVTRNMSIDHLRKTRNTHDGDDKLEFVADDRPNPEAAAIASSDRARIDACLDELDAEKADAVRSVYLEGHTYKSLAQRHDVALNTMKTWLRRSLMKLKECLAR